MGDEEQGPKPEDVEAPSDWPVVHRAAQVAWSYRDIAYAHVDRPNPAALASARAELLSALVATVPSPRCSDCHFWEAVPDEDGKELGQCRRYPPSYEGWSITRGEDWCGEFLP